MEEKDDSVLCGDLGSSTFGLLMIDAIAKDACLQQVSWYVCRSYRQPSGCALCHWHYCHCEVFNINFLLCFLEGAPPPNNSGDTNKISFNFGSGSAGGRVIQERGCCAGMQ